jgi:hypothetical protein
MPPHRRRRLALLAAAAAAACGAGAEPELRTTVSLTFTNSANEPYGFASGGVSAFAASLPLCLSAGGLFVEAAARVAAAGLTPGGAPLEGRTLFVPTDAAFDEALAPLALTRARLLASPPERLAELLAAHVVAPGAPALATRDAALGAPARRASSASVLGSATTPPAAAQLLLEKRLETRTDVAFDPPRTPGEPPVAREVTVQARAWGRLRRKREVSPQAHFLRFYAPLRPPAQVPAWFVHTDARTLGGGGARLVGADARCRWFGATQAVHFIDAVLLPDVAARYSEPGPYAVTQHAVNVRRNAQRAPSPVRVCSCFYAVCGMHFCSACCRRHDASRSPAHHALCAASGRRLQLRRGAVRARRAALRALSLARVRARPARVRRHLHRHTRAPGLPRLHRACAALRHGLHLPSLHARAAG